MNRYADPAKFDTALRAALGDNPDLLNATLARLTNAAGDLHPDARAAVYELSEELDLDDEQENQLMDMVVSAALDEGVTDITPDYTREVYVRVRWAR